MATTGTFNFAPSSGEVGLNAFSRIGIRGPDLLADHMQTLLVEANMMQAEWSNKGPNLWTVDLQSVPLIQAQASYTVPPETVMILDAFITTVSGGASTDRVIVPVSRSEYASYPNKTQQSPPTTFWFDRLIAPTVTLWPVPDATSTYTLNYYRFRQVQDAALARGLNLEIPYLWLDAASACLAHRLARHNFPKVPPQVALEIEQARRTDAEIAYTIASTQNTENVGMYIVPMTSGYFR
jgi:hypothetical protein